MSYNDSRKVCEICGSVYDNFCINCAYSRRQELVEELMDKYGLSVEKLIIKLASLVDDDNFSALNLAVTLKNMKPATKTDITSGGTPLTSELRHVKKRLVDKVARVARRKTKKADG